MLRKFFIQLILGFALFLSACVSENVSTSSRTISNLPNAGTVSQTRASTSRSATQTAESTTPATPVPYDPLFTSPSGTQQLTGVALSAHATAPIIRLNRASGTIGANGTDFDFSDGVFVLQDSNGPDANDSFSNGTLTMLTDRTSYKFSTRYSIAQGNLATAGVFGIATQTADMPKKGTASYNGRGEISEVYGASLPGLKPTKVDHVASSSVDVDFATGKVNAALEVQSFAFKVGSQVDRISARGMALSDSSFSGTNVKMFNKGTRVYPTGSSPVNEASGQFYGAKRTADDSLTPAEVGGVMHSSSPSAVVFGTFIAK